jgi:hypothetical protein
MRRPLTWLFAILLGLSASSVWPANYLVRPDGSGDYPTIQEAIDAAEDGDVILLDDGTFIGPGNKQIDYLGKAITVRSLFGDPRDCIIDCQGDGRAFRLINYEGPESILRDITARNGSYGNGGAMYCSGASPTVIGCIFEGNSATLGGVLYT